MFLLEVYFVFFFVYFAKAIKRKQYCEKVRVGIVTATIASSWKHFLTYILLREY